jgi:hypothetical protein
MLPYGDVWRESRRIFTKYFSNSRINEPRDVLYVRRFLGQLLQKPNDFLQHVRTYVPFTISLVNGPVIYFAFLSLVGSSVLSMTYGISIRPYGDPLIAIAEEADEAIVELLIAGAFLVDILPILMYVPEWFPGAKFKRKAAMMRTHVDKIRNAPFAATKKLMVFTPWLFLWIVLQFLDDTHSGKWRL